MNILPAIRREERRLEKVVSKVQGELNALRGAAEAFGRTYRARRRKRRKMSAAARAKISRAAKRRWAKVRAQARKWRREHDGNEVGKLRALARHRTVGCLPSVDAPGIE
jgi:hypothetical protein